jgi:exodeoxyribonuclease VIII
MNIDICIDLETLDNKVPAVITQIGAAQFDRLTGKVGRMFSANVDAESCQKKGMTISASTVMWWLKQSKEAQNSLTAMTPLPVDEALKEFKNWAAECRNALTDKIILWCHASFDFPILMRAYELCSIEPFWGYRDYRDIRTVVDLADINLKNYRMEEGKAHNALQDVLNQIKYTSDACRKLACPTAYEDHATFDLT